MTFSKGCPYCGGMIQDGTTTFTVDKQTVLVVVRSVPAIYVSSAEKHGLWIM
jgi:YgiT-type zinc finger domain-containing protein